MSFPLLQAQTASASAALNFTTWYSASYRVYLVEVVSIVCATDAVNLLLEFSTDGGSSYDTGNNYWWATSEFSSGGTSGSGSGANATSAIQLAHGIKNTTPQYGVCGSFKLYDPSNTSLYKRVLGDTPFGLRTTGNEGQTENGGYTVTTAVNAFRIRASSGNLTSGGVYVYGISLI